MSPTSALNPRTAPQSAYTPAAPAGRRITAVELAGPNAKNDRQYELPLTEEESLEIASLYRQYAGMMIAVARRMLPSTSDAEDAVHQLFSRLPRLLKQHKGHSMGGWLRRATVTECLMHLRRNRGRRECTLDVPGGIEAATHTPSAHLSEINSALGRLAPSLREVIVLRYFMACSHRNIADILDISEAASEIRACRALKQLRLILQEIQCSTHRTHATQKCSESFRDRRAS